MNLENIKRALAVFAEIASFFPAIKAELGKKEA
jgi:hypothetical protein